MQTISERQTRRLIETYYAGCNAGDVDLMTSTFAVDVVHYFLEPSFEPVRGADHLARYWRKSQRQFNARWVVDHCVASGNEAVIEWSLFWKPQNSGHHLTMRGTEWFILRDGKIAEVRAYFHQSVDKDTELQGFPYSDRGYARRDEAEPFTPELSSGA